MRAAVLTGSQVEYRPHHAPAEPGPGEIPVRVLAAGLCETDLQLAQGYMGFQGVLGHEFVGVAEAGRWAGHRVVGEINCSCQRCPTCLRGQANHCPHRTVLGILNRDGAFAERVWLPVCNLHSVPEGVPDWQAVFTEPLAAAFRIPEQIPLSAGLETVVLGDGRLGNLCAQVLHRRGCRVTVVGKHPHKLALLERLGIGTRLLSQADDRRGAELVVDCTGSPTGLEIALRLVRPRGTVVLKTTVASPHQLSLAPVVIDEIQLVGSRCGPFPPALDALARGEIDLAPLVEQIIPLDQVPAAITRARTTPVLKILIDVAGGLRGP
ncbi:MAG: MDR/zinc-dependent alcohol dehydrogenase-like family protein [Planctomycetaceae bacterium]|jgi:threonine dehydrogenase-like Zn-dependent dehydrogenase